MKTYRAEWEIDRKYLITSRLKYNASFYGPVIILSVLMAVVILMDFTHYSFLIQTLIFLFAILFCYGVLFGISYLWIWIVLIKRKQPYPFISLTIDENGVQGGTPDRVLHLKWQKIKKVKELKDYILIKSEHGKVLIPKRGFQMKEDVQEFLSVAEKRMKNKTY